eukprot:m.39386 g.39386  ORF g.39386 m.39386 type:complete len:157 (+) comp45553_c0_seq2:95-565(+)
MSSTPKKPTDFLKHVVGRNVVVKLNSGVTYRGKLACLDGFMNIVLEQTEEFVAGQVPVLALALSRFPIPTQFLTSTCRKRTTMGTPSFAVTTFCTSVRSSRERRNHSPDQPAARARDMPRCMLLNCSIDAAVILCLAVSADIPLHVSNDGMEAFRA